MKTHKEIADYPEIDYRQVDYIREELLKRLNVKNRVAMATLAYQSGIVPLLPCLMGTADNFQHPYGILALSPYLCGQFKKLWQGN